LFGGSDADALDGGRGFDTLTGGSGSDRFEWDGNELELGSFDGQIDRISDFEVSDRIYLNGDANTNTTADDAYSLVDHFTGAGGELMVTRVMWANGSNVWLIQGDRNGDSVADFNIQITATTDV